MKIRIFLPDIKSDIITLTQGHHHYLANVLRVGVGREVFIFTEQEEWLCVVREVRKRDITLSLVNKLDKKESAGRIVACIPFIKPDTLMKMSAQAVELGVKRVVFFKAMHSSARLVNQDRVRATMIEALEQCEGMFLPGVSVVDSLEDLMSICKGIIFYANEHKRQQTESFPMLQESQDVAVIVGPEGGFSAQEISTLSANNAISVGLGSRVLRSDTALVTSIAVVKCTLRLS